LVEGPHLVNAAVAGGVEIEEIFALEDDQAARRDAAASKAEFHVVAEQVMSRLGATEHPRGPVGVIEIPAAGKLRRIDTVVLWGVADPGNAGTLLRSAAAFDCDVAVTAGTVDLWSPKVLRAAAGAHFGRNLVTLGAGALDELRSTGLVAVAAVARGGEAPERVLREREPVAILVGSEAHGLPAEILSEGVAMITIPMPGGTESLNVAAAGAILIHERYRLARSS